MFLNSFKGIKQKIQQWFAGRMPHGEKVVLNARSVYILPSKVGLLVAGVLILMLVGATNYQNNLAFALTFLLLGIGLVTMVVTAKNLQGIEFSLNQPDELFVGELAHLELGLRSNQGKTHFSVAVGLDDENLNLLNIPEKNYATLKQSYMPLERGLQSLARFKVTSEFPFGWLRSWGYFRFDQPLLVYPKPLQPLLSDNQAGGEESEQGSYQKGSDDLFGLRSHLPGEPYSRVDWKAFARERGLLVREFVEYQSQQLCFSWFDFPQSATEERLSFLTYLVVQAAAQNLNYSLELPASSISFGEGRRHRNSCLKALALYQQESVQQSASTSERF